jgi:tetratricopeptide (TPR) repeat protein
MAIELRIDEGSLRLTDREVDFRRSRVFGDDDVERLRAFAARYRTLMGTEEPGELLALGRALSAWLSSDGWLEALRETVTPPLVLEVRGSLVAEDKSAALLAAPWELLAWEGGFLAGDSALGFSVVRRLGDRRAGPELDDFRLGLTFMAAAPRGGGAELGYEAEEVAILGAAGDGEIDLVVEDSGDPEQLGKRLMELEAMAALHLSCHGHNAWRPDDGSDPRPVLMLEDERGEEQPTGAGELVEALGERRPRFVMVSACLSTAAGGDGETVSDSLASALVRAGVPAVLGWEGSVGDGEATAFARGLYGALARRQPVEAAVGQARRGLLNGERPAQDWHLARLWLGPRGGGPLVAGNQARSLVSPDLGPKEFMVKRDERLPVASRERFVGRRRELQESLRVLRGRDCSGVLLHGMGRLGKSSLAARIAGRRPDLALAVVYEHYGALHVLGALREALADHKAARDQLKKAIETVQDAPGDQRGEQLEYALLDLLSGPCKQASPESKPVLLVIDDLERILKPGAGDRHVVEPEHGPVLKAVLRAFDPGRSDSRLLLTSRYQFTLKAEDGRELADRLHDLQLPPMGEAARDKLALRQEQAERAKSEDERLDDGALANRLLLLGQAKDVARGNPGLQDLLAGLVLSKKATAEAADGVLSQMEAYIAGGEEPDEARLQKFLENLALESLLEQAGPSGKALLRAATLFHLPVPAPVIEELASTVGGSVRALRSLGLLDRHEDRMEAHRPALAVNDLVDPHLATLEEPEQKAIADLTVERLYELWGGSEGSRRPYPCNLELTRLGLLAGNALIVAACAADAVAGLDKKFQYQAAADLGNLAIPLLEAEGVALPLDLLRRTGEACVTVGEVDRASDCYGRGLERLETLRTEGEETDPLMEAALLVAHARLLERRGHPEEAMGHLERAADLTRAAGSERDTAVTMGYIARLKAIKGEVDEALRLHQEKLKICERLGDVRSHAIALGDIAWLKADKGEVDEALHLHQEKLKICERLGDVRERVVTLGNIARFKAAKGEVDEALRLLDGTLDAFGLLGDVRSRAIMLGDIARLRAAKGEVHEALRLHEERLEVYERLGDVSSHTMTLGDIARLRAAKGEVDEALRLHQKTLEIYERLGDVRSHAVTLGDIARLKAAKGEMDEALRLHGKRLEVYERLGDVRSRAITLGDIAVLKAAKGEVDEALRLHEERLEIFERLGDVRERAITLGSIANLKAAKGEVDEALRLLGERLEVNRGLGDQDGIGAALWDIAQIEQQQGRIKDAAPRFAEAYEIVNRIGRLKGIAVIGEIYGQILASSGQKEQGLAVLRTSLEGFRKLGRHEAAQKVEQLMVQIQGVE